jgi:hypothetical protein
MWRRRGRNKYKWSGDVYRFDGGPETKEKETITGGLGTEIQLKFIWRRRHNSRWSGVGLTSKGV